MTHQTCCTGYPNCVHNMTDNDKAPASEVSGSDRAREEFSTKVWVNTNGNAQQIASNAGFPQHPTVIAMVQSLLDEIDSQRLALEEKDAIIKERYCLGCSAALQPNLLSHQFCQTIEQLHSRVKELEARIQHMDNACLDNFGVTITSILD